MNAYGNLKSLFYKVCDEGNAQAQRRRLKQLGAGSTTVEYVMALLEHDATITRVHRQVAAAAAGLMSSQLKAGDRLGPWSLQRELGRGGMGCVFLAARSDGHYDQHAAIKLLVGWSGPYALSRLARERQILATLNHPNIARLIDGGSTPDGQPYLVMEYAEGQRIDEHCKAARLGLSDRLALFQQVCDAVGYAHRQLVIHCDIKPSNVLVSSEGRAMLLDFGIALLQNQADTARGSAAMTPRYASPEQRAGKIPGIATDIYSLGLLLEEIVRPIRAEGLRERELSAIVARATVQEPEGRYLSVQALSADIARFAAHLPLAAVGRRPAYLLRKLLRRRWPWLLGGAASAGAVAIGLVVSLWQWHRADLAARQSAEVTRYLSDMLASANPTNHGGNWPTVLSLLEQSRSELPQRFAKQPDTLWQLRHVLASTYRDLDRPDIALSLVEEQLALAQQLYGGRDPRTIESATLLGYVHTQLEAYDKAIVRLEAVRPLAVSQFGASSKEHERVLRWLAYSYACVGRLADADRTFSRARELTDSLYAAGSEEHVMLLNLVSVLRVQQGRHREAQSLLKEAQPHWHKLPRSATRLTFLMRYNLIVSAMRLGDYDSIESDASQLLQDIDRVLGDAKLSEGLRTEMAWFYTETGQFAKALRERDIALQRAVSAGVNHPAMLLPMKAARLLSAALARQEEPALLLKQAHKLLTQIDAAHADVGYRRAIAWLSLGRLGMQLEDGALIEAAIRRLRGDVGLDLSKNSALAARIDQLEGQWARLRGDFTASATSLRQHVRYYEQFAQPASPRAWSAQLDLAYTLILDGDPSSRQALEYAARLRPGGVPSGVPLDRVQEYLHALLVHKQEDAVQVVAARRQLDNAFGRDPMRPQPLRGSLGGAFF